MRFTLYTDFALRTLIQVALNDGKLTTINDIARSFGISKQHLTKVVSDLSQKGYLDTVRGRGGGIRLRRPPRDINIGQNAANTRTIPMFTISRSQNRFLKNRTSTPTTTATSASTYSTMAACLPILPIYLPCAATATAICSPSQRNDERRLAAG